MIGLVCLLATVAVVAFVSGVVFVIRKDEQWQAEDGPRPWDNDED